MLDPQCAVLIEGGNSFPGRDKLRASGFHGLANKVHDGLPRRSVVPRGERVLSLRGGVAGKENRQQGKRPADGFH